MTSFRSNTSPFGGRRGKNLESRPAREKESQASEVGMRSLWGTLLGRGLGVVFQKAEDVRGRVIVTVKRGEGNTSREVEK
jgi:hypothetical protein